MGWGKKNPEGNFIVSTIVVNFKIGPGALGRVEEKAEGKQRNHSRNEEREGDKRGASSFTVRFVSQGPLQ